ncbi:MAG: DNA repair protein [Lachnospiraceae bacterium]|nr:DNA repair protein [Lachnospiraceae bacterium]
MSDRKNRMYLCIDLKSFYASVECVERGLDPYKVNLIVADLSRTEKTICLAASPAIKALGVSSRCRVFEIPKNIEYIAAPPRMALYLEYSAKIYSIYLKYISKEDIHVYSVDEVFLDVTDYLTMYQMDAKELGVMIIDDIVATTGITATCGIGTNLYLAKIALDISAKHTEDHMGYLTEELYCETLWDHRPLTDFWRIGPGTAKRLERVGIFTMGEIAQAPEDMLYDMFGIDAELLIDHAWGVEPTLISDIKKYNPMTNSITSGQVLDRDYAHDEGRLVVKEMTDLLCLDLVARDCVTESVTIHIGYSNALNLKPAHGSTRLAFPTSSARIIVEAVAKLYDEIKDSRYPMRRAFVYFNNIVPEGYEQYNMFVDPEDLKREHNMQKAIIDIKSKFGKNAILKGMNLEEGAKTIERNSQIGGHRAGEDD